MPSSSKQETSSSRLIFRNLPSSLTPPSLREHLSHPNALQSCGITDLRLVPKRRFAFVGYKDEQDAAKVKEYFDGSFLGSGKIKVDYVQEDNLKPAPVQGSSASPNRKDVDAQLAVEDKPKKDTTAAEKRLKEFMQVMKGTSDDGVRIDNPNVTVERASELLDEKDSRVEDEVMDDAEWLQRRQKASSGVAGVEEVEVLSPSPSAALKPVQIPPANNTASPEDNQVLTTGRLFLRNLAFVTTSEDLSSLFTPFGSLREVHIPLSSSTKEPVGTAFILFEDPNNALRAYKQLDGKTFMGRLLHILPGRAKHGESGVVTVDVVPGAEANDSDSKGLIGGKVLGKEIKNVKAEVAKKQREASGKGLNWASLYMNSDAVASSVADRMGIKKADILNGDASLGDESDSRLAHMGSAVKLALAETSIIAETKKYFEEHGVVLDALSQTTDGSAASGDKALVRAPRSKTTLLVKNIPYGTSMEALTALFSPHGNLRRVLMPPSGTLAVVEFDEDAAASSAFKAVSYRRLGNAVIYLEKAPTGLIRSDAPKGAIDPSGSSEALARVQGASGLKMGEADPDAEAGSTLYVKNLAFDTTTEKLNSVFAALPAFAFARVSTKPDAKNPTGPRLSMGFGFVGFKTKDAAGKALEGLKGFKLDGHVLEFKWAQRDQGQQGATQDEKGSKSAGGATKKSKTTKMIVKNLPFEASKKDIKDLFSTFGTLKSCRLPKKHNSSGRGFAFLDFSTRQEAESAMEALKHTHLLGRHLVLEWAAEDEQVAEAVVKLRKRTRLQFAADGEGGERKKKKLDLKGEVGVDEE